MSKRNAAIIIIVVVMIIIGGLLFFYFNNNGGTGTQNQPSAIPTTENPFVSNPTNKTDVTPSDTTTSGTGSGQVVKNTAKLLQIYRTPTSGSTLFVNNDGGNVLRFVDRANGNIYEYPIESQTAEGNRITNTTVPKIESTVWSSNGNSLVLRYLDGETDNIASFSAKINTSSSTTIGSIDGSFLTANIKQLVANPSGNKIFELFNKTGGGSYGVTASFDGSGRKQVFDSSVSFWNISWPKESVVTFTTKPSFRDTGSLFFFNPQTGSMERILGDVSGLSTITNSNADRVAYSSRNNGTFDLDIYDVKKKESRGFKMATLADKCVWGIRNSSILYCAVPKSINPDNYPDAWYQGTESFDDSIWSLNTDSGATKLVYQSETSSGISIDAIDLRISQDDRYISFSNKDDLSLWLLDMRE